MTNATPAGWFPDPSGRHQFRYWDGTKWTEHVGDRGTASTDPLEEQRAIRHTPEWQLVRELAAIELGLDPRSEPDGATPLRTYCVGVYQIDLVQIFSRVEDEFGVAIEDDDWASTSTPNWESCTVDSITEIVRAKGRTAGQPRQARPVQASGTSVELLRRHAARALQTGEVTAGIEALEMALILAEVEPPSDMPSLLANLANVYLNTGLFTRGHPASHRMDIYERLVRLSIDAARGRDTAALDALSALTQLEARAGRLDRAWTLIQHAVDASQRDFGLTDRRVEPYVFNAGVIALHRGEFEVAERYFQWVLDTLEHTYGLVSEEVADACDRQSVAHADAGFDDVADHLLERALQIRKAINPRSRPVALTCHQLAKRQFARRDFKYARSLLLAAISIMIDVLIPAEQRSDADSGPDLERNFALEREAVRRDESVLDMLADLAVTYHETGVRGVTLERYEQLLAICEATLGTRHIRTGRVLISLGSFYSEIGRRDAAREALERALGILEENLGPDHADLASVLYNLACTYRAQGVSDIQSEALLRRCIRIREGALGASAEQLAMPLRQLAYTTADLGDRSGAITLLQRVEAIEELQRTRVSSLGSEEQKVLWSAHHEARSNATLAFHAQTAPFDQIMTELAWTTLVRTRGRTVDALADSIVRLRSQGTPDDIELLEQWTSLLTAEANWYATRLRSGNADLAYRDPAFDSLRLRREQAEQAISRRVSHLQPQNASITADLIRQRLTPGAALVEFSDYWRLDFRTLAKDAVEPDRYGAFVVTPSSAPAWIDLGPSAAINARIRELLLALQNPVDARDFTGGERRTVPISWRPVARALDELILEPLRPALGTATHLMLVPSAELCRVPFAALLDRAGQHEIRHYTITYLSTSRDLLQQEPARPPRSRALIVAAPAYGSLKASGTSPARGNDGLGSFLPLEGALQEGQSLHNLLRGSRLETGMAATKGLLRAVQGPHVLHLATHGFHRPDETDALSRQIYEFSGAALPSPLLCSGVALADANTSPDGLLNALEVCGLDLDGTELVTLSACETGLGEVISHEGVYGFRRSMFLAGAASLVLSLIRVPDDTTRRLMTDFYAGLLAGRGRSEALRAAQLSMLSREETAHPVQWAGFVLIGNPEPLRFPA